MGLTEKTKKELADIFAYYYENYIWGELALKDNSAASEKDYAVRAVMNDLGIREYLPNEIKARF